jgi:hypothetical protein
MNPTVVAPAQGSELAALAVPTEPATATPDIDTMRVARAMMRERLFHVPSAFDHIVE